MISLSELSSSLMYDAPRSAMRTQSDSQFNMMSRFFGLSVLKVVIWNSFSALNNIFAIIPAEDRPSAS